MTTTATSNFTIEKVALDNDSIGKVADAFHISNEQAYDMLRETIAWDTRHERQGRIDNTYRTSLLHRDFATGDTYLQVSTWTY